MSAALKTYIFENDDAVTVSLNGLSRIRYGVLDMDEIGILLARPNGGEVVFVPWRFTGHIEVHTD